MGNTCAQRSVDSVLEAEGVRGEASGPPLFARKAEVYITAARVFADYKLVAMRADQLTDEAAKEALYDAVRGGSWRSGGTTRTEHACSQLLESTLWLPQAQA